MDISALIDPCLKQAQVRRNKMAKTTKKSYRWQLRIYANWLSSRDLDTPSPENIVDWMDHIQRPKGEGGRGFSPRSTHAAWAALVRFDKWLVANKDIPEYKESGIPKYELPDIPDPVQYSLTDFDADRMGNAVESIPDPFRRALARAVYMVLSTASLRNAEVRGLEVANYNAREQSMYVVHGKGNKNRTVGLCDQCCTALDFWLRTRPSDTRHKLLFCWDRVRGLGEGGVRMLTREISRAAGFNAGEKSHRPHAMRHGSATRAHNNGESLDQVRVRLGQSDIRTTQIYLHTDEKALHLTRNVTQLNLDAALADGDFKRFAADVEQLRTSPSQTAKEIKKSRDPRMRPRSKLKREKPWK